MVPVSLDSPRWSKSVSVLYERTRSPACRPQHVLRKLSQQVLVSGEVLKPRKTASAVYMDESFTGICDNDTIRV